MHYTDRPPLKQPLPPGVTCAACGGAADGVCTTCGKFFCRAHREGTCGDCYDRIRPIFGIQGVVILALAGGMGYWHWTTPAGDYEGAAFIRRLMWCVVGMLGFASLMLFFLAFRKFPPDPSPDEGGAGSPP